MSELIQAVKTSFEQVLGYQPTHIIQAPGRVNLIGEHTDYNDGFVLPCAIDYQTVVAATQRDDNIVRVVSVDYDNAVDEFDITSDITFQSDKMWGKRRSHLALITAFFSCPKNSTAYHAHQHHFEFGCG